MAIKILNIFITLITLNSAMAADSDTPVFIENGTMIKILYYDKENQVYWIAKVGEEGSGPIYASKESLARALKAIGENGKVKFGEFRTDDNLLAFYTTEDKVKKVSPEDEKKILDKLVKELEKEKKPKKKASADPMIGDVHRVNGPGESQ